MPVSIALNYSPNLARLAALDPEEPINAVLQEWRGNAEELLQLEIYKVMQRTQERAYDTGALMSSVTGRVGGASTNNLISIWFNNAQQYAQWGRYYAPYQEGPPIGLSTYTNEPRHMLYDTQNEDGEAIRQWGVEHGQAGADAFVSEIGTSAGPLV